MPQHFLNNTQVSTTLQHVRGSAMPKPMRTRVRQPRLRGGALHHALYLPGINACAPFAHKERLLPRRGQLPTAVIFPCRDRLQRHRSQRHHPLFVTLAADLGTAARPIHAVDVQSA